MTAHIRRATQGARLLRNTRLRVALIVVAPRLGVGVVTVLVLAGQIVAALAIDHFGLFGTARQAIDLRRAIGAALIVFGIVLTRRP